MAITQGIDEPNMVAVVVVGIGSTTSVAVVVSDKPCSSVTVKLIV